MNKDLIILVITIVSSTVAVISTIYKYPVVGIFVFALGLIAYLGHICYSAYTKAPGSVFLRLLPVLVLLFLGGAIYWFWPSSLEIVLYADQNNSGRHDPGEPGIGNERLTLTTDADLVSRPLVTDSNGQVAIQKISRGIFCLWMRGMVFEGQVRRGHNLLRVGFLAQHDVTKPKTRIFLGDELGFPTTETYSRKIYAHLWFQDVESGIESVEIDWGEGRGWENVDLDHPTMRYHTYFHEYRKTGRKTVKFKATNLNNLCSFPKEEPPRPGENYHVVHIRPLPRTQ